MRDVRTRREVHLVPRLLGSHTRSDGVGEDVFRQLGDDPSQVSVSSRVLNRVTRQGASVADQVAEESEFRVVHRL